MAIPFMGIEITQHDDLWYCMICNNYVYCFIEAIEKFVKNNFLNHWANKKKSKEILSKNWRWP